ncbi:hypothetical protein CYMTET_5327 [Cymbomonas tetramitiformis]|uniref:Uncharacterized protein n=1 Tax=Cymbomonas tetramitiformis TaxID=36881 RepID=A0AAE0GZJ6_9CHLO|nr:hypothetical protein CYMTET_5327 [Cymbomonas tetramitiformis]
MTVAAVQNRPPPCRTGRRRAEQAAVGRASIQTLTLAGLLILVAPSRSIHGTFVHLSKGLFLFNIDGKLLHLPREVPSVKDFPAHRTIVRYPPHDEASNLTDTLVHAAGGMPTSETDRERLAARDASDRRHRECRLYRERITLAVHVERAARARQDCAEREASERETHRKRVSLEMNPANKRARLTELAATRAMLHERYLRSMTGLDVLAECACLQ